MSIATSHDAGSLNLADLGSKDDQRPAQDLDLIAIHRHNHFAYNLSLLKQTHGFSRVF